MLPKFETPRLILRDVSVEDAPSYQEGFANYNVVRYLNHNVPWPYPNNGAKEFIKNIIIPTQGKNNWHWGIVLKDKPNKIIGTINLWKEGRPDNRGFWLAEPFWGNGLMAEATYPVNDFAFNTIGMKELILSNAVENDRSRRIKERTGCRYLKTIPFKFVDSGIHSCELWSLSKEAWDNYKVKHSLNYKELT